MTKSKADQENQTGTTPEEQPLPAKEPDLSTLQGLFSLFGPDANDEDLKAGIIKHVLLLAEKYSVAHYKLLLLYDDISDISGWHSNRIYDGATSGSSDRDILLVIYSSGGRIEPAYLISKTCKRLAKNRFIVAVPRKAKSAATLLALGADEIHMGFMSELGPIDPQIGGFPALSMHNALKLLADLSCKYPGSSEMLGNYLAQKLDLRVLGYFERVGESAVQYGERLLLGKELPEGKTPNSLANHFVNHYKDHGFVIDADEATALLGTGIVKQKTNEYYFANALFSSLDLLKFLLEWKRKQEFDYVGSVEEGLTIRKKKERLSSNE